MCFLQCVKKTDRLPDNPAEWDRKKIKQAKATKPNLVQIHVREGKTAKGTWNPFQKVHESSVIKSNVFLLQKLYRIRLGKGQNIHEYINAMLEIVEQLCRLGGERQPCRGTISVQSARTISTLET